MKKIIITLLLLLITLGCTNQKLPEQVPNPNEEEKQGAEVTIPPIEELTSKYKYRLFPDRTNLKVNSFDTKEQLINYLTKIADRKLAEKYVDIFYLEQETGLFIVPKDLPIFFNKNLPYRIQIDNTEQYIISQDRDGKYTLSIEFRKENNEWIINDIKIFPKSSVTDIDFAFDNLIDLQSILLLVNKYNSLTNDFIPSDLTEVNIRFSFTSKSEKKLLRMEAARRLEEMFKAAEQDSITLYGTSGYRSYDTQEVIFAYNVKRYGSEDKANKVSAFPGESEHQTGLAIDISSESVNYQLIEEFGNTIEGKWVKDNAHKFGFIIRYPKGKENITGYIYEPWHIRYVGKEAAEVSYNNITLEEYIASFILGEF